MSLTVAQRAELLELADGHVEDQLDEHRRGRLEQLVCDSAEAAELFIRYAGVASLLERRDRTADTSLREESLDEDTSSLPRRVYLYLSQPFQISLIIATLAVTIGVLSLALARVNFGPFDGDSPIAARPNFAGRFTRVVDCQWSPATLQHFGAAPAVKDDVERGKLLELLAGECDLLLDSGTKLRIVGPATLRCTGDNEIDFLRGQMTAYVPPRAIGFTAHAAGAKLIDLGTEFGLLVDPLGSAEAHVYRGAVSVELAAQAGGRPPIQLVENEALRWQQGQSDSMEQMAANPAGFRRFLPGEEIPSWFTADSAHAEPQSKLPFEPAGDDLLQGLVAKLEAGITPHTGTLAMLTDGFGSDPLNRGIDGRVMIADGKAPQFILTYDLGLAEGQAVAVEQLRVFTYNTDSRVFIDCDVEGSLDGENWFPLHQRLTNGRRGAEFNLPSGTPTDYYHDYAVAWLTARADVPPVRHLRLTFRGSFDGQNFAVSPSLRHSSLTEIDLIGQFKHQTGTP